MRYHVGDLVIPSDLPKRWTCRVVEVEAKALAGGETIQILTLAPLAGPWREGTLLVRLDGSVRPAAAEARRCDPIARAAAAAAAAGAGTADRRRRGKVIRLPVASRRLVAASADASRPRHE